MRYLETNKKFYGKVLGIALPITAQSMITIGVNMVNTIMLGAVSETTLSAASLGNQFIMFFQICCMGIGMGASVLTSRYWGRKDILSLKKAITIALRFALAFGVLFTLMNVFATETIIRMYTKEESIITEGVTYLRWCSGTYLLICLSIVCTNIMRSVNLVKIPLLASIAAFLINLLTNYMFIFGKLGAPKMGTAGAALGMTIARVVETGFICGYFFFFDKHVRYRVRDILKSCSDMVSEYIRVSIPVLISDGLLGLGNNVVAMIGGHIGSSFVSANAITTVTQNLSTVFIQGLAFAGCIITGQTLGEGRVEEAKRQGFTFFWLGLVIGSLAGLVIYLIRTPVIGAYTTITDETRQITYQLMNAISIIVVFQTTNSILTKGVLRGGGDTRFLMIADIIFLWAVSIPLGALVGLQWHLPAFWVYVCLKIDQFIKAIWCIFRLKSWKWIKKVKSVTDERVSGMETEPLCIEAYAEPAELGEAGGE